MNSKERAKRDAAFKASMSQLIHNPHFGEFIEKLREYKDIAVEDSCSDKVVSDPRASMAAIGEIRTYLAIISIYDETVDRTAEERGEQSNEPV